jgi:hypothetical protein
LESYNDGILKKCGWGIFCMGWVVFLFFFIDRLL